MVSEADKEKIRQRMMFPEKAKEEARKKQEQRKAEERETIKIEESANLQSRLEEIEANLETLRYGEMAKRANDILDIYDKFKQNYLELQKEIERINNKLEELHKDYESNLKELQNWRFIWGRQNELLANPEITQSEKTEIFNYLDKTVKPTVDRLFEENKRFASALYHLTTRYHELMLMAQKFREVDSLDEA